MWLEEWSKPDMDNKISLMLKLFYCALSQPENGKESGGTNFCS